MIFFFRPKKLSAAGRQFIRFLKICLDGASSFLSVLVSRPLSACPMLDDGSCKSCMHSSLPAPATLPRPSPTSWLPRLVLLLMVGTGTQGPLVGVFPTYIQILPVYRLLWPEKLIARNRTNTKEVANHRKAINITFLVAFVLWNDHPSHHGWLLPSCNWPLGVSLAAEASHRPSTPSLEAYEKMKAMLALKGWQLCTRDLPPRALGACSSSSAATHVLRVTGPGSSTCIRVPVNWTFSASFQTNCHYYCLWKTEAFTIFYPAAPRRWQCPPVKTERLRLPPQWLADAQSTSVSKCPAGQALNTHTGNPLWIDGNGR